MKTTTIRNILWSTLMVLMVSACGGSASANVTVMMEMVDDPLEGSSNAELMRKSMGAEGVTVEYKKCMSGISKEMYEGLKEEAQEIADIKRVTLVDACPSPYDMLCKSTHRATYYYTDAKRILDGAQEECQMTGGKSTLHTQSKVTVVKKEKATFVIDGQTHRFESLQNCIVNPMIPEMVSTPKLGDVSLWVALKASTGGDNGCMIDVSEKENTYYHAEGKSCHATYDGKKITGKATARKIGRGNGKKSIEISFDIACN